MHHQPRRGVIIGGGYFGGIHLEAWARLKSLGAIAAICDVNRATAEARAVQFSIPRVYTHYREALSEEKPDFADIVTRPDLHAEITAAAADLGIAVLCQKPLAPTYDEAEQMVCHCEARGVRLMANENWRWQPWYRELRALLDSGVIGKPFYFHMRHRVTDGTGDHPYARQPYFDSMPRLLLVETMIHFLDTARFLMGDLTMRSCTVRRVNPRILGEDIVIMVLEDGDHLVGVIDGNRLSPPETEGPVMGDARIEGEKGTLSLLGDGRILIRPLHDDPREHSYHIPRSGYRGDSVYHAHRHFLECLTSGQPFETSGRDYLETTKLVFDGYRMAGW